MSKLDEIQDTLEQWREIEPQAFATEDFANLVIVLSNIVEELKRIDAEQKAIGKVVREEVIEANRRP